MPGLVTPDSGVCGSQACGNGPRKRFRRFARISLSVLSFAAMTRAGLAAPHVVNVPWGGTVSVGTLEVIQFSIFAGVMGAALLSAIWLIRERGRTAAENGQLRTRVAELSNALSRSEALLNLKDQRVVVWPGEGSRPTVIGELPADTGSPRERSTFLAFGRWLAPQAASQLDRATAALREKGEAFDLVLETQMGALLEVQGRKSALYSVVRFSSLTAIRTEHARLKLEHKRLRADYENILGLVNALDMPFWLRDDAGCLTWVNAAYAGSVEAENAKAALREGRELLPTQARAALRQHHLQQPVFKEPLSTVVAGERHMYMVTNYAGPEGSAGIAVDSSEVDALRREHESTMRSHAETLDQLTTAVAIFDSAQNLKFYNQAFLQLWDLDPAFLENQPENALLLDRLRSDGKLAEQPEWRHWKEQLLSAYRAVDPQEHWWHLPDGRTLRVIATPQPKGGVTWVFENLTEKIDLESRYNAVVQVQSETLNSLAEGVAVFGSDGRLRLSNPAFRTLWNVPESMQGDVHISALKAACDTMAEPSPWGDFVAAVTGFDDERRDSHGRIDCVNGTVLNYAIVHLPNGQVMMTFVEVTDSVNVERALKEKNEALEKADKLKNDFVQHVSYELRSPLTNIIGFTELLALETMGPLTERQREYVDHIGSSSSLLLTVVNDILDLATVDAGIMELDIGEVEIRPLVEAATGLVSDRLREHNIGLEVDLADAPSTFLADENRVRQILYNLLSNAANFAPENGRILLSARESGEGVEFCVHDNGPGMPEEVLQTLFQRFETGTNTGRRRGAGLGLSIVKSFVELHGGTVEIETGEGRGTAVSCRFPLTPSRIRVAAE